MFSKVINENRAEERKDDERVTALLLRVAELERKQEQDHKSNYKFIINVCFALLFMFFIMLISYEYTRSSFRVFGVFQDVLLSKARRFEERIRDLEYSEIDFRHELGICKI